MSVCITQAPGVFQEKASVPSILRRALSPCWGEDEERPPHTRGEEAALGGGSTWQDPGVSVGLRSPGPEWGRTHRESELCGRHDLFTAIPHAVHLVVRVISTL